MDQSDKGKPDTRISKEVQNALDAISSQESAKALSALYDNIRRHKTITEYERGILNDAIEIRMREIAPAGATRLFGPKDGQARRILQAIYDELKTEFDFSGNRVDNGVKTGGTMMNGERHVDVYLSYKTQDGVNVGLTWLQDTPGAHPYLRVSVRQVGGASAGTLSEHHFDADQKNAAVDCYKAELAKVIG